MKPITYLFTGTLFLLFGACQGGSTDSGAADSLAAMEQTPGPFRGDVSHDDSRLKIRSEPDGEYHQVRISGSILGRPVKQAITQRTHPVTGAAMADINGDKQPELYLFSRVPGPGAFGRIFALNFASAGYWSLIEMQALPDDMMRGYRGYDSFEIGEGRLLRSFPLFKSEDPDGQPSAGRRTVAYELVVGAKSLQLKPVGTM